jgi:hypothetical protein
MVSVVLIELLQRRRFRDRDDHGPGPAILQHLVSPDVGAPILHLNGPVVRTVFLVYGMLKADWRLRDTPDDGGELDARYVMRFSRK